MIFVLKRVIEIYFLQYIRGRIYSKNDAIFIAEFNGKPVGHMIITIKKSHPIFEMEKYGRINTVYVEEEFSGKNINSKQKMNLLNGLKRKV